MLHFDLALFELNEKNLIADCMVGWMVGWLSIDFVVCAQENCRVRPFVASHFGSSVGNALRETR